MFLNLIKIIIIDLCIYGYSRYNMIYVTGFWKIDQIVTLGLSHFIGPSNGYTHTLHVHSAITKLGDWSAFLERVLQAL